jgi:uncharacterized protein
MNGSALRELSIPTSQGELPALLLQPAGAQWLYLLAHGAGAGMRHRFMDDVAQRFATRLEACVRDVAAFAATEFPESRVAAGGKSMGGRMTSQAQSVAPLPGVECIVFIGFPLHPAGRPATTRSEHLRAVEVPMLFLQGTRDALAELALLEPICTDLGAPATLHIIDGADHGFAVLKRSGRTGDNVLDEIADVTADWLNAR